ncbi:MAG TPA: cation acetate symporter, partial [Bacillota bacterium]
MNAAAAILGLIFVVGSLVVSVYARRRTQTVLDFYLAGRRIGAFANASAICGDYFSAASFLGVAAAVYVSGVDGVWFATGFAAGLVPVLLFLAAPLRRSGAYTIPEFLGMRFGSRAVRLAGAVLIQLVVFTYLVPQLLGLGETWSVAIGAALPGLTPFDTGMLVGALVVVAYVALGGMRAATWQQIFFFWFFFSAVLLVVALAYLNGFRYLPAVAELAPEPLRTAHELAGGPDGPRWEVRDDPNQLHPQRPARFGEPGHRYGAMEQVSVVLGLALGTSGLPHIIMRHLTSPTGRLARDTGTYVVILATLYYVPAVMAGVAARALLPGILAQDARYA